MAAFSKQLTESEVKGRLAVPREWRKMIDPLFGGERREIVLRVVDGVGMYWEFRCAVRRTGRYKKPVLQSDGWLKFVNYKRLRAGDKVSLEEADNNFRETRFKLRALRYDAAVDDWLDV